MEVIGKQEQRTFLGGTRTPEPEIDVYSEYAKFLQGKLELLKLAPSGPNRDATKKELEKAQSELKQLRESAVMIFDTTVKPYSTGAAAGQGLTNYDSSTNTYRSTFSKNEAGGLDYSLVGHELHHQYQYLNGDVDKDHMDTTYSKQDEIASTRRMVILQYGTDYFKNQTDYDQTIKTHVDSEYSTLPNISGGSDTGGGTSSGGGNTGPGTTGIITTGYDEQGYYHYYSYLDPNGPYTSSSGNYSTGFAREFDAVTTGFLSSGYDEEGYFFYYSYMDHYGPYTSSSGNYSTGFSREPLYDGNGSGTTGE